MEKKYSFNTPADNLKDNGEARIIESHNVEVSTSSNRPTIITVLCGYFFVNWCLSILNYIAILSQAQNVSFNFNGTNGLKGWIGMLILLVTVVSLLGYWFMKKWAVYLYTLTILVVSVYTLAQLKSFSVLYFIGWVIPLLLIIVGFKYLSRMS